jgi:hypothetical protein
MQMQVWRRRNLFLHGKKSRFDGFEQGVALLSFNSERKIAGLFFITCKKNSVKKSFIRVNFCNFVAIFLMLFL